MLIRFDSKAGTITMFGEVAISLLRLMGQSGAIPGAILSQDIPAALARLRSEPPMTAAAWNASGNPDRVVEFLDRVLRWRATAREAGAWRRRVARLQARHWTHRVIDRLRTTASS